MKIIEMDCGQIYIIEMYYKRINARKIFIYYRCYIQDGAKYLVFTIF